MPEMRRATLKQRILSAGGWSIAGYGASQVIRFASSLVMTRLLAPEMFGVMLIALMVTVVLTLLSDLGLTQNIIQSRRGDDPRFLDTAWVMQIVRGILLWLVALLVGVALHFANAWGFVPQGSVYASPVLPLVIAVSSFSAVILGLQSMKMVTAQRSFDQKRVNLIALISQVVALLVMIPLGVATRSIWALVAGALVAAAVTALLSHTWLGGHTNRVRIDAGALKELIGFGKWVLPSSILGVLAANGDRLLLGGFVDEAVLGFYAIAVLLVGVMQGALYRLYSSVVLPALSEVARTDMAKLRQVHYKLRFPVDLALLFCAGLFYMSGQLVIDLLYDPRYAAAGGMFEVLALSLIVHRYGVSYQLFLALGVPKYATIVSVVGCCSLYVLVPLLYFAGGLNAAIWGVALHGLAYVPLNFYFISKYGLNDYRAELRNLVFLPAGMACGMAVNHLWPVLKSVILA